MKIKKWVKISLFSLLGLVLVFAAVLGYFYYEYQGKYPLNETKYPHYIGYLPESDNFERCSDKIPIGYYSSAHNAFNTNKQAFTKFIHQNFKNHSYSDTGFLNLRFLINCRGEIGDMEINELDENLVPSELNKNLVSQLIQLTVLKENWQVLSLDKPRDRYMYLIYKIENGEITEILP